MNVLGRQSETVTTYDVEPVELYTFDGRLITVDRIRVTSDDEHDARVEVWNPSGTAKDGRRGWRILTSAEDERVLKALGVTR